MLSAFANSMKIPDLRRRILFTLGLIFICRIVTTVPTPGVNAAALQAAIAEMQKTQAGGFMSWIDLFSGGALSRVAVGALSIWPYISASIILQLMTAIVPTLERLAREGDTGRQKLNQYTRYLTLGICVFQALMLAISLEHPNALGVATGERLVVSPGWPFRILTVLTMTTGTMLLMWLGEQVTARGIGNGISVVITVNIVSRLPAAVYQGYGMFQAADGENARFSIFHLVLLVLLIFLVVAGTVALTQGLRKIAIHTASRSVGRKTTAGQKTYMPLRVNYSGVMPIIFAGPMLMFPAALLRRIPGDITGLGWLKWIGMNLGMGHWLHTVTFALLILFFSYFWVATQFNPLQIADDLKRSGGYVPGIRPGKPTAEFLDLTMSHITLIGALGLVIIAVLPSLLQYQVGVPSLLAGFMGGTSLLIIVGVTLDVMRQVESFLLMRHYDGFLKSGRLRGRR